MSTPTKSKSASGAESSGLVGRWFLTLDEQGTIMRQGEVVAELPLGHFLVHFYSWLHGGPSTMAVIHIGLMVENPTDPKHERFEFFVDDEDCRAYVDERRHLPNMNGEMDDLVEAE